MFGNGRKCSEIERKGRRNITYMGKTFVYDGYLGRYDDTIKCSLCRWVGLLERWIVIYVLYGCDNVDIWETVV
jgi:hypothetical protein